MSTHLSSSTSRNFYPRPPRGGRRPPRRSAAETAHFYPRPPRGGRRGKAGPLHQGHEISIHALREEGDMRAAFTPSRWRHFYPRPPRGGRHFLEVPEGGELKFLSTPSARRATLHPDASDRPHLISIHALREEGDRATVGLVEVVVQFLSTPSARRATPPRMRWTACSSFLSTPSARRATQSPAVQR